MGTRGLFPLVALLGVGCSSLLGLDDFEDAPAQASGGAGGVGGAAGAGGVAGGSGGSAGVPQDGGDASDGSELFSCKESSELDVFVPSDFPSDAVVDAKSLRLVRSVDADSTLYVTIGYKKADDSHWLAVRPWDANDTKPRPANFAPFPSFFNVRGGFAAGNKLVVVGMSNTGVTRIEYPLNGKDVTAAAPTSSGVPTPPDCFGSGYEHGAAFQDKPLATEYAITCENAGTRTAYFVDGSSFHPLESGSAVGDTPAHKVKALLKAGPVWLVGMEDSSFHFGADPTKFGSAKLDFAAGAGDVNNLFAATPTASNAGAVIFPGRLTLSPLSGTLYSGVFPATAYPTLGDKSKYTPIAQLSKASDIPRLERANYDAADVAASGISADGSRVLFYRFSRDGKPRVLGFALTKPKLLADTMATEAAPVGLVNDAVFWTENTSIISVRSAKLLCGP